MLLLRGIALPYGRSFLLVALPFGLRLILLLVLRTLERLPLKGRVDGYDATQTVSGKGSGNL